MSNALDAWGGRWNKAAKGVVAFDPNDDALKLDFIPIGMPAVDVMLGGGIPRGRTTVLVGEASSGKTLMAQLIIAQAQRNGGTAMFFDVEHTFDPSWVELTGVNLSPDKLIVVRPRSLEQCFDMIIDALDTVQPDVLVLDSIPALVPTDMMDAKMEERDFRGLTARKITEGIAKITQANHKTALVVINQIRTDMSITYGSTDKMPGGRGLKFFSSLILRLRSGKWITDDPMVDDEDEMALDSQVDGEIKGFLLKLKTEKNKQGPPWQTCELKFYFSGRVDGLEAFVNLCVARGILTKAGSFYTLPDGTKVQGAPAVAKLIRKSDRLKDELADLLRRD